ncbi:hypothetical protein ZWY2020_029055 [Hordeum vulgare]|nr:hypothetical protein ZWY2020_029055 [Hordeum vulgare]
MPSAATADARQHPPPPEQLRGEEAWWQQTTLADQSVVKDALPSAGLTVARSGHGGARQRADGTCSRRRSPPKSQEDEPRNLLLLRLQLRDAVACRPVSRLFREALTAPFLALLPALRLLRLGHPRPEDGGCLHAFDLDRRCWLCLPFTSFLPHQAFSPVASFGSLLYLWVKTSPPPAPLPSSSSSTSSPAASAAHPPKALAVCNPLAGTYRLLTSPWTTLPRTLLPPPSSPSPPRSRPLPVTAYKGEREGTRRSRTWRRSRARSRRPWACSTSSTSTSPPSAPRPSSPSSSACKLPRFPAPPAEDLPRDPLLIPRLFCVRRSLRVWCVVRCRNALVAELDTMQKLADGCNIQVPMEVVNLIDDGKNPDEFTRDVLNGCIAKNQITKGKTDAFKSLRKHLPEELGEAFPHDVEAYRQIRATSSVLLIDSFLSRSQRGWLSPKVLFLMEMPK